MLATHFGYFRRWILHRRHNNPQGQHHHPCHRRRHRQHQPRPYPSFHQGPSPSQHPQIQQTQTHGKSCIISGKYGRKRITGPISICRIILIKRRRRQSGWTFP
jgi:hypothetical protein